MAPVLVLGGSNIDLTATTEEDRLVPGTSNPGRVTLSAGGVGRNIAETLARLGVEVTLLSAIASGALGDAVLDRTAKAGVDLSHIKRGGDGEQSIYLAIHDNTGELFVAVSDMTAAEACDESYVGSRAELIRSAPLLVIDANLPVAAIGAAVACANEAGVPVILEPVSVAKAGRLSNLRGEIYLATPNRDEVAPLLSGGLSCEHLLVTRGAAGVGWYRRGSDEARLYRGPTVSGAHSNGAGDAFLAGVVAALSWNVPLEHAVSYGIAAARLTVETAETTRSDMSRKRVEEVVEECE